MVLATTAIAQTISAPTINGIEGQITENTQTSFYQIQPPTSDNLKAYLAQMTMKYGGQYYQLYRVISCESGWNPNAKNPKSTASGVAQFLDSTWNNYCGGNKDNSYDQIRCLVVAWTGGFQSWWQESAPCWSGIN